MESRVPRKWHARFGEGMAQTSRSNPAIGGAVPTLWDKAVSLKERGLITDSRP